MESAITEATTWLQLDGVEGVAQGERDGRPCIVVLASQPRKIIEPRIPETFRGFEVTIRETLPLPAVCVEA